MVGHRSERYERFGWASARLDDGANWVPARATVALAIGAAPDRAAEIVRTVRRDAPAHPSPNAGVVEAAFAAALDVRLGGTNVYRNRVEERGELGTGKPPIADDVERAIALMDRIAVLLGGALALAGAAARRRTHRRRP
jgi:adenosylcobinamide-phosphate synthase